MVVLRNIIPQLQIVPIRKFSFSVPMSMKLISISRFASSFIEPAFLQKGSQKNHEFGVPRWPPQDIRLIETMATSVATYGQHMLTKTRKAHWDLEYQDGADGCKILLAEYIVCVIQYYSDH